VQLLALRHDLRIESIRGNVDTRLRKVADGEYDAAVLAAAGLERLGLGEGASQVFSADEMLPAVGQGVLAVECRAGDAELLALLQRIDDLDTRVAMTAERAFLRRLGAGCRLPVGALGIVDEDGFLWLRGLVASEAGAIERDEMIGPVESAEAIGAALAEVLAARAGVMLETGA
jgi:hydroxymethylbilane synthase